MDSERLHNMTCPVCDSEETFVFLERDRVPVHQNLPLSDPEAARTMGRGQLMLSACRRCGFVFNRAFDASLLDYGQDYDNTQSYSPAFDAYIDQLAERLLVENDVRNCSIVEVGCGKGHFLRRLIEPQEAGNCGYGFDPTYVGPESDCAGRLQFRKTFFDEQCSDVVADVVVCRHVIEHVARPIEFLKTIRRALRDEARTRVFLETPCVEWILQHQVHWDFFYEHCSLFTSDSLTTAFQRSGFHVERVEHLFAGQYLWLEAVAAPEDGLCRTWAGEIPELARQYGRTEQRRMREWEREIRELRRRGRLALWGAGAKGVTFANLVDPQREWFSCVVDINPGKQGRFVAGTGHPIVSPAALGAWDIAGAVVLNPNYCSEISDMLRQLRLDVTVIDLMQTKAVSA